MSEADEMRDVFLCMAAVEGLEASREFCEALARDVIAVANDKPITGFSPGTRQLAEWGTSDGERRMPVAWAMRLLSGDADPDFHDTFARTAADRGGPAATAAKALRVVRLEERKRRAWST